MTRSTHPEPRPPAAPPSVCLVILNYNGRGLLERFLPALAGSDYQPLEIVVVDNASTDDSCGWLQARWPQVTLLRSDRNLAWAGGNNIGIRHALEKGHRYVVLANNDIEPHPDWIRRAVEFVDGHPAHGIAGFHLFEEERTRPAFETACRQLPPPDWRETENVMGCAMFCDRDVFRSIGLFDETYRFYAEESDLELRALAGGWKMAELNTPVWHLGEGSTRKMGLKRAYLQMRNSIRMKLKLQGVFNGLCMCKTVLNRACNPWLRLDWEGDYTLRRYRPASLPVNAALALAAMGWNLLALPATLMAGRRDRERIARWLARPGGPETAQHPGSPS